MTNSTSLDFFVLKVFLLTTFALTGFAFNSILCRMALGTNAIDAASFTVIRLLSGALTLLLIFSFFSEGKTKTLKHVNWFSAIFLFAYAICFSFAYVALTTATGALILFGMVQATMIVAAFTQGERPSLLEWVGLFLAAGGLVYLVFPGLESPPIVSSILMTFAGVAWGFYTLRGRTAGDPLTETTRNFIVASFLAFLFGLLFLKQQNVSPRGILLAVLSGAIASGIGYSVWYAALKYHTATRAAVLQLSVPVIAAVGGLLFLSEAISLRLISSSVLILGGIGLTLMGRNTTR